MTDDELIRQLQNLPREAAPPDAVRHIVARAAQGSDMTRRRLYWQIAVAASLFAAAFVLGRSTAPRATSLPQQREFVLLLYGGEPSGSPDDRVREYAAWASRIRNEGRRVSGERLADESWSIGAPAASLPLRGFFVIQARDEQDARALAEAHPHVRYGGGIVVRPIADAP
jgi:hypothetical protein